MDSFKSKRAWWWGGAVFLLLAGVLVYALVMPYQSKVASEGSDVHVPSMRNVPESDVSRMELELEEEQEPTEQAKK